LLASAPNEVWSWDISKLKGPVRGQWFHLYVVLDVFSRYIVGWTVQAHENAQVAAALIEQATSQQHITPEVLTLHADRGAPMRSKLLAELLEDLGVAAPTHVPTRPQITRTPKRGSKR
jgi:putative transposase